MPVEYTNCLLKRHLRLETMADHSRPFSVGHSIFVAPALHVDGSVVGPRGRLAPPLAVINIV